ncbi:MAG: DUF2318 domain-containing protein [Clostridiales bacterium]|jgi:uncharacterized membrane protein|nr:DUF2318 domain-containing protein [Clostridiales bacterium]
MSKVQGKEIKGPNAWLGPAVMVAIIAVAAAVSISAISSKNSKSSLAAATAVDQDLVIEKDRITSTASFFSVEIEGTQMEVLAVEAPDGSIRTAFNTCQVCYASGRGYYKQEGKYLVCQNCGNSFTMDQVEVISGGCNPVPIMPENKTEDGEIITISKGYLTLAKNIFSNWKTEY